MPEEGKAQLTWCWKWRSGFFSLSWSSILASRSLRSFVPLLSVFPSVSCSFLSFFFQPFPLVLEAGVGEEAVSGFLVSLSSSLRPFSLFCCVIPCFSGFFFLSPLCFRLCSLFTSFVFSPSVFFVLSRSLSLLPVPPGFFVLLGSTLVFLSLVSALFPQFFFPLFVAFSLASSVSLRRNRGMQVCSSSSFSPPRFCLSLSVCFCFRCFKAGIGKGRVHFWYGVLKQHLKIRLVSLGFSLLVSFVPSLSNQPLLSVLLGLYRARRVVTGGRLTVGHH